jgi:hypothetical protein
MKMLFFVKTAIAFAVVFSLSFPVIAQEAIVKTLNQKNGSNAITVKSIAINPSPAARSVSFEIQVDKASTYFMSIMWHGLIGERCDVLVDNGTAGSGIVVKKDKLWEIGMVYDGSGAAPRSFALAKGTHTVVFKGKNGNAPHISELQIGESTDEARIKETESLKQVNAGVSPGISPSQTAAAALPAPMATASYTAPNPTNPKYDYYGKADVPIGYTYWHSFSFNAGTTQTFYTKNSKNANPVLYLFQLNDPDAVNSWYDDNSGGGVEAKISKPISKAGTYILVAIARDAGTSGTADLYYNNSLYVSYITLGGTQISNFTHPNINLKDTLNYFTAKPRQVFDIDPIMFIANGPLNKILAYSDDYHGVWDTTKINFDWGWQSRIKYKMPPTSTSNPKFILLGTYSAGMSGTVDVYAGCEKAPLSIVNIFPLLKPDDAIKSGELDNAYCCYDWAGGLTTEYTPTIYYPPWCDGGMGSGTCYPDSGMDHFYGNNCYYGGTCQRFKGAMSYVPTTKYASDAVVDIFSGNPGYGHASVTKPGDNYLHGYDWESKWGSEVRFFHPRLAIEYTYLQLIVKSYKIK